jgi:hypothetical protein
VTGVPRRPRPPRRRRPIARILLSAALLGIVFALGVALGQATVEDSPPETAVTSTRVIVPVASMRETVTVTTTVTSP